MKKIYRCKTWRDGTDRIEVKQSERKPVYEEQAYVSLFRWLKGFAT